MLRPHRHPVAPVSCRARGKRKRRLRLLAIFGMAPLTLLADPAFGQTTRTNQFVTGSPNSTQTEANAASGVATTRLMLPQTDSTIVKQPTADVPTELWTPPSAPPQAAPAGFSGQTPVGPNQNSFETFHPIADSAVPTIAAEVPSQPTEAPRIAMRPVVQERGLARPTPASETIPAVRTARPQRLPAAEPSSQSATANSSSQSATQPSAAQRFAEVIAQQRAKERAESPVTPPAAASGMYLATQTAKSKLDQAWTHFQQAELEYSSAAYASAETSAWQTLHLAAEAIDLHKQHTRSRSAIETGQTVNADPSQSAVQRLRTGRNALNEARDFVGPYATDDPESIARLARSHHTPVVRQGLPRRGRTASDSTHPDSRSAPKDQLGWYTEMLVESTDSVEQTIPNATEAIDRYLDLARMELSEVAAQSLLAAQAMDLLAAIRLGRGEATQLPGPSAICLRRAAVQGQSSNPDLVAKLGFHLADVGLVEEATWALQHSLTLRYDVQVLQKLNQLESLSPTASTVLKGAPIQSQAQTRRTPDVVTMTPEQFASVSRSVIPAQSNNSQGSNGSVPARNVSTTNPVEAQPASYRLMNTPPATAALGQSHPISGSNANEATEPQQPPTRNSSRFLPQLKKWW